MFPYKGYAGKYLRINLTEGTIHSCELEEERAELYLGGNGFGTKILWDEVPPEVDPLSPENRLIIATGVLCGTLMPNSSRIEVIAKSPLTGIYGDANAGGFFAPELKFAGYDLLVFEGRAKSPLYLYIEDGQAELLPAEHLWGKGNTETARLIQQRHGDREIKVASMGPAGENLVRFASINFPELRTAARTGVGAVMGSKNLKAVAVRGCGNVEIADPINFYDVATDCHRRIRVNEFYGPVSRYGTPGLVTLMNPMGRFPTKNFQMGSFLYADDISAEELREHYFVRELGCFNCPVGCDKIYRAPEGTEFAGTTVRSLEYETLDAFGAAVWNNNLPSILQDNVLCDELGLDTISAGRAISFAMELYEKGILTKEETDGLDLTWGNYEVIPILLKKIAKREGFGDLLAEGTLRAARRIGRGAERYVMHVKGQEIAGQDGRAQQSMGLAHVTSSRGADHLKGFPTIDETGYPSEAVRRYGDEYMPDLIDPLSNKHKAMLVKDGEDFGAVVDSSGLCKSGGTFVLAEVYWTEMAKAIQYATGMDMDVPKLKTIGERIYNLQRCYNIMHGISRKDDTLPERFLKELSPSGHAKGHVVNLQPMLEEYYELRRWDKTTGFPTPQKLRELGLEEAIDRIAVAERASRRNP
ncbi:MAG: aldehyde ferredoxin oxidoreductase family protein [Chloroflexi bacterium]|nr:aldehyde ferredoxin oxidoreductase family protein [Chloroflexota bacterium]MCL5074417.1 aldehyde ferredoxin oxidoreductase family protein [Chloroflexota bacterium]